MTTSPLNQFWTEFIELYKSLPELWKKDTDDYTNKSKRLKAYDLMVQKYKEVDRDANIYTVKKKINNLRTCFRRELNKVRKSEQSALGEDDIYSPTLWYFSLMDFLMDEEDDAGTTHMESVEEVSFAEEETIPHKRKKFSMQSSDEPHTKIADKTKALSASWEVQYRDLEPRQKLFANRLINEVLYQGALGKLHENSYKILEMAVEEPYGDEEDEFSPVSIAESQYYITESTENASYNHIVKKEKDKRKPMRHK